MDIEFRALFLFLAVFSWLFAVVTARRGLNATGNIGVATLEAVGIIALGLAFAFFPALWDAAAAIGD